MNTLSMQTLLVDAAAGLVGFAANWLLQSTLLIAAGLSIGWLVCRRGSAVQSAVYRTTLLAAIVCPLATSLLARVGIPGWSLDMPAAWALEPNDISRAVVTTESAADALISVRSDASLVPADVWPAVQTSEFSAGAAAEAGVVSAKPQQHALAALPVVDNQDVNHPAAVPAINGNEATAHVDAGMGQFVIGPFGRLAVGISLLGLAVAAVLLIRLMMAWRRMNRLRSTAVIADPATQHLCQELAALLSVSAPQVLRSPYVTSPCLAGLVRPAVLLPEADPSLPIRDVMIHELAHLRRCDCHWNLLRHLAGALLFYQPLLWKLSRRLEETAEEVCDDFVVQYGGDRNEYAHRLVDIAALASTPASLAGVGIVSLRSILAKRVTRILDTSRSLSTRASNQLLAVVIAGGLALTLVVSLVGLGPHASIAEAAADEPAAAATPGEGHAEENAAADEAEFTAREKSRAAGGDKADDQSSKTAPVPAASETGIVTGSITHGGQPAAGAHVAIIGTQIEPKQGGDLSPGGEVIAAGTADENGSYRLSVAGASSKTHRYVSVIARKEGTAIAWQMLNLDSPETEVALELPADEPIRGKLIDIEGQPAADVTLKLVGVQNVTDRFGQDGVGYPGGDEPPAAWLPPATSDEQGRFTIRGVPAGHGVFLQGAGSDRFAPQDIALNTGMPEQRGERDRTYRSLVQNLEPGEEAVLTLPPAQWFEGVVRYEDSGEPAAHARVTIWASQEESSSMISVSGQADKQGRYRINPKPGVRFGVTAYPPAETAYLARQTPLSQAIRWDADDRVKQVDIALPRGVWVRGTVKEAATGEPVAGAAVQYLPQSANNPNVSDDILTGWQDIQLSDEAGRFSITVLPGPGHLLVHGQDNYVLQEIGSRQPAA